MLSDVAFREKWTVLSYLPQRDGSDPEEMGRFRTYYDLLQGATLEERDFCEACDRIMFQDQWFPTVARIIAVTDTCAKERRMRETALARTEPEAQVVPLVCRRCHGAHYVRQGGYSPSLRPDIMPIGSEGTRTAPCPDCTTGGIYDPAHERLMIQRNGGVPHPNAEYQPDMQAVTWPARMAELRGPDGHIDGDKLYRLSRELRGLDPDVDERPTGVAGWKTTSKQTRELVGAR